MIIGCCTVYLYADWVTSLKEKRMVLKSVVEKTKHKFNVSIAEVEDHDKHKSIVIGFACVSNSKVHAENILDKVAKYIEFNTDAVVLDIITEIL